MSVRFHADARIEFLNAARRYASIRPDLGQGFYHHIEGLVAEIEEQPTLFRVYRPPHARRHFRRPFPYAVVYVIRSDEVFIVAVMHFKQPPSYWKDRLH